MIKDNGRCGNLPKSCFRLLLFHPHFFPGILDKHRKYTLVRMAASEPFGIQ